MSPKLKAPPFALFHTRHPLLGRPLVATSLRLIGRAATLWIACAILLIFAGIRLSAAEIESRETQLWVVSDRTYGSVLDDVIRQIRADTDGAYAAGFVGPSQSGPVHNAWFFRINKKEAVTYRYDELSFGETELTSFARLTNGGFLLGGLGVNRISHDPAEPSQTYARSVLLHPNGTTDQGSLLPGLAVNSVTVSSAGLYMYAANTAGEGAKDGSNPADIDFRLHAKDPAKSFPPVLDRTYGGSGYDYLLSLVETADGFLLGGISDSPISGNKASQNRGMRDWWVVKTTRNGDKVWDRSYGGPGNDELNTMLPLPGGRTLLGGSSHVEGKADQFLLIEIDANGDVINQWAFGGSKSEFLNSMIQTADGGYLLGGHTWSPTPGSSSISPRVHFGLSDYWVVKLDANFTERAEWSGGGVNDDVLVSVTEGAPGEYWLGGYSSSPAGGGKYSSNIGGNDGWIVRLFQTNAPIGTPVVLVNGVSSVDHHHRVSAAVVKLQSSIRGGELYYTLDGAPATTSSLRYTAPFQVTNSAVVNVTAAGPLGSAQVNGAATTIVLAPRAQVNVNQYGHGRVIWERETNLLAGDVVSILAVADPGWSFGGWRGDVASTSATLELTVGPNSHLEALFYPEPAASTGGRVEKTMVSTNNRSIVAVTLRAVPEPLYAFSHWEDGATNNPRTFVVGRANRWRAVFTNSHAIVERYDLAGFFQTNYGSGVSAWRVPTSDGGLAILTRLQGGFGFESYSGTAVEIISPNGGVEWIAKEEVLDLLGLTESIHGGYFIFYSHKVVFRSAKGEKLWQIPVETTGERLHARRVVEAPNGDATIFVPNRSGDDILAYKVDSAGGLLWTKTIGGTGVDQLADAEISPDGGSAILATSSGGIGNGRTSPSFGSNDVWFARVSPSGDLLVEETFGGLGKESAAALVRDNDTWVIGATSFSHVSGNKTKPSHGGSDFWLLRISDVGEVLNEYVHGGTADETLSQLLQQPAGDIIAVGASNSGKSGTKDFRTSGFWAVAVDDHLAERWEYVFPEPVAAVRLGIDGGLTVLSSHEVNHYKYTPYRISVSRVNGEGNLISMSDQNLPAGWYNPSEASIGPDGKIVTQTGVFSGGEFEWRVGVFTPRVEPQPRGATTIDVTARREMVTLTSVVDVAYARIYSSFPDAHIFYTTDGTTPGTNSALYTTPLRFLEPALLKARSYSHDFSEFTDATAWIFRPEGFQIHSASAGGRITHSSSGVIKEFYASGEVVTLTAVPEQGNQFLYWTGDLRGSQHPQDFVIVRDVTVNAVFGTTLTPTIEGEGSLIVDRPDGLVPFGDNGINAVAGPGYYLSAFHTLPGDWQTPPTNGIAGLPLTVTTTNQQVELLFSPLPANSASLNVASFGPGTVTISPHKLYYAIGETVTLSASPAPGAAFSGFSRDAQSQAAQVTVVMNESKTVAATFSGITEEGLAINADISNGRAVFTSADLTNWTPLIIQTNQLGVGRYIDTNAPATNRRFFRW